MKSEKDVRLQETETHWFQRTSAYTHFKLQCRGSSSNSARGICGGNELTNFRARAEGVGLRVTLSRLEMPSSDIVPL